MAAAIVAFMNTSSASKSLASIFAVLALAGSALTTQACATEAGTPADEGSDSNEVTGADDELTGSYAVGTSLITIDVLNMRKTPDLKGQILQVIPEGTTVKSASKAPQSGWYGITYNGMTGWVFGAFLAKPDANAAPVNGNNASFILSESKAGRIGLYDTTFGRNDGADALSNIRDAAAGKRARRSVHGNAPGGSVELSPKLLSAMTALRKQYNFTYFVTAIAGASHSPGSYHYAGRAMDIGTVNGQTVNGDTATTRRFMQACRDLGGVEVLGPSNRSDHQDHLHCAF
jgi:uncharacterized protein YgiM (DUF1202 family)